MDSSLRLQQQMKFIVEIDKLKHVLRQTFLIDKSRRENDAEHSWHLAIMAVVLQEHAPAGTDLIRVMAMVLVHDLVEIYAGDTFAYDKVGHQDKDVREQKAADRIFGLLPEGQDQSLRQLWEEYEQQETKESNFALALDRLQPLVHNYYTEGGTWHKFDVPSHLVFQRVKPIAKASPALAEYAVSLINESIEKGWLRREDQ